ncbi:MAG: carbonic anhydrase [Candidatus Nanopelagicales bacterium]|jgi:carbonic anhydrase|nr:carbonic anhydrase [Candidatus Nanopelagicales bacterium]MCU0295950.1 carbonic anhydrase [Candidatus Nanopelagicales bacterium]MCU0297855.1 carbonic anhydrase [Candidatus Nanopelagicales bacterium]
MDDTTFEDVIAGNHRFVEDYAGPGMTGRAARGLALITCMDSRIDPLAVLGMRAGDMKILRNAGARVTDDVLRTLVLATYLLDVNRIIVMPHTDCRMAKSTESEVHTTILEQSGVDTRSLEFRTIDEPLETLAADVQRIRSFPFIPDNIVVAGGMYDVDTGKLTMYDF